MRRFIAQCRRKNSHASTGIQKQILTVFISLWRGRRKNRNSWKSRDVADDSGLPEFPASGVKAQEYTNATTTQPVNPETGDWNREMIQKLGYPEKIFPPIRELGLWIGRLKKKFRSRSASTVRIVLPATHDTGSAVVAVPSNEEHVLLHQLWNLVS